MTRHPEFFLVGAPKCGTTAMHAYLRRHPEIFLPETKEIHYYGSDLGASGTRLTDKMHEALFLGAKEAQRVGETCIWALYSRKAAAEIKNAVPNARIIIMLRNPIAMAHALHSELVYQWIEDIAGFPQALAAEEDRKRGRLLPKTAASFPPSILFYRAVAKYAAQVERYLRAFTPNRVHVIVFDDFVRDPESVYRSVLEFLGVDPEYRMEFPVINPNKRVRSLRLRRLMHLPPSAARRLGRALIPSSALRRRLFEALDHWNVGFRPRPPIRDDLRLRLEEEFAPDVQRLSALLGRDLTHWVRQRPALPEVASATCHLCEGVKYA